MSLTFSVNNYLLNRYKSIIENFYFIDFTYHAEFKSFGHKKNFGINSKNLRLKPVVYSILSPRSKERG